MVTPDDSTLNRQPLEDALPVVEEIEPVILPPVANDIQQQVEGVTNMTSDQLKLQAMRESGELSPHDFDLNYLFQLLDSGAPLTRTELRNQALVLSKEDALQLGAFDVIYSNGEQMTIDADSIKDSVLILFPSDLGD